MAARIWGCSSAWGRKTGMQAAMMLCNSSAPSFKSGQSLNHRVWSGPKELHSAAIIKSKRSPVPSKSEYLYIPARTIFTCTRNNPHNKRSGERGAVNGAGWDRGQLHSCWAQSCKHAYNRKQQLIRVWQCYLALSDIWGLMWENQETSALLHKTINSENRNPWTLSCTKWSSSLLHKHHSEAVLTGWFLHEIYTCQV